MDRQKAPVLKRGNRLGFLIFRTAARAFGLRGAYGLLYFVCLYYLAFDRAAYATTMAYVTRRFRDHGPLRRVWDVYQVLISQGRILIDRFALISGGASFQVDLAGGEALKKHLQDSDKGLILLTAHVGSWQVAMSSLERFDRTVHLLMRPEDNAAVRATLNIDQDRGRVRIISAEDGLAGVMESLAAVNKGDIVSIMGDRAYGYRTAEAMFLGEPVRFPIGAFTIAAAAKCPIVVLLSAKVATTAYRVDVSRIIEPPAGSGKAKQAAVARCAQEFAAVLEEHVARHPYQWFVFADIWSRDEEQHT